MIEFVKTVEDRVQNVFLTAMDNIITPISELAVKSMNTSSGQEVASVTTICERGEQLGIFALHGNVCDMNRTFLEMNSTDETEEDIADEVSDLAVSKAQFDWRLQTNHTNHRCNFLLRCFHIGL